MYQWSNYTYIGKVKSTLHVAYISIHQSAQSNGIICGEVLYQFCEASTIIHSTTASLAVQAGLLVIGKINFRNSSNNVHKCASFITNVYPWILNVLYLNYSRFLCFHYHNVLQEPITFTGIKQNKRLPREDQKDKSDNPPGALQFSQCVRNALVVIVTFNSWEVKHKFIKLQALFSNKSHIYIILSFELLFL